MRVGHDFAAAPADRGARWSWLAPFVIGALGIVLAGTPGLAVAAVAVVPVVLEAARKPVGYAVDSGTLTVRRRAAPAVRYPMTGAVERVGPDALGRLRRRRAPGAYVGASGTAAQGGRTRYHLTDRSRAVRVETRDGAVIVSPRDPDAFVGMARQR